MLIDLDNIFKIAFIVILQDCPVTEDSTVANFSVTGLHFLSKPKQIRLDSLHYFNYKLMFSFQLCQNLMIFINATEVVACMSPGNLSWSVIWVLPDKPRSYCRLV